MPERRLPRPPVQVELRIDRLMLDVVPPGGPEALAAAVERALTRLIAQHGVPGAHRGDGRTLPPMPRTGARPASAPVTAEAVGARIAEAVYAALAAAPPAPAGGVNAPRALANGAPANGAPANGAPGSDGRPLDGNAGPGAAPPPAGNPPPAGGPAREAP